MQDVSPHALIRSFITGLSDFLTTIIPSREKTTFTKSFWIGTVGAIAQYKTEEDVYLVGCTAAGGVVISTVSRNYAAFISGTGTVFFPDTILVTGTSSNESPIYSNFRVFIPAGTVLFIASNVALAITLLFES